MRLDERVGVANRATVVGGEERYTARPGVHPSNLTKLVLGLLACNRMHHEAALHVVQKPEVLTSLFD